MHTWSYALKKFDDIGDAATKQKNVQHIVTPLSAIPVNSLVLYMPKSVYENLPVGASAQSVRVKVTPIGHSVCYPTATTTAAHVNSVITLYGCSAVGLNKSMWGRNVSLDTAAEKPMMPTSIKKCDIKTLEHKIWGNDSGATNEYTEIPACLGISRKLPFYFAISQPKAVTIENPAYSATFNPGWQKFLKMYQQWEWTSHENLPIHEYHYDFVNGLLKPKGSASFHTGVNSFIMPGGHTKLTLDQDLDGKLDSFKHEIFKSEKIGAEQYGYYQNIEKNLAGYAKGTNDYIEVQPLIYVGAMPVSASLPATADAQFTNVRVDFLIETEIDIQVVDDPDFYKNNLSYDWNDQSFTNKDAVRSAEEILNMINTTGMYPE